MSNLSGYYESSEKYDLALTLVKEAFNLQKAKLGPEHPDTLVSMNNLAQLYWRTKQLEKSIPLFKEALKRLEAKLGRDHPKTLHLVANLGVNYMDAGRLKEAIPLLEEAYRGGQKDPSLYGFGETLMGAYAMAGERAKLANLIREQVAEARKSLPPDISRLAQQLAVFGLSLLKAKAFVEAEPLLRECLAIREKAQADAWYTFNSKSQLGGALLGQQKYAEAEPLLVAGYDGMKRREATIPPQAKDRLTEALERLVQLSEATGRPDEAAKWRKELETRNSAQKPPEKKP